jgi:quercetin dioxygenase-like cupin family protein
MNQNSFNTTISYSGKGIKTEVILESTFTKEIRILLQKGAVMREHKTPFAILVHILKGKLDFSVEGQVHNLKEGDILSLEGDVVHELYAIEDSMVRLTLSKYDRAERVKALEG